MSATMTMTLVQPAIDGPPAACPNCGAGPETHIALAKAQRQIEDLQAQVRLLNQKATAAGPYASIGSISPYPFLSIKLILFP